MYFGSEEDKQTLVRLLPSCGGMMAGMWYLAKMIRDSESMDIEEILGDLLEHPDSSALRELMQTCQAVNGIIDTEGIIAHFASYEHLHKFDSVPTVVAAEFPEEVRQVAHTLLPLTLVGGRYYYDNGQAHFEIKGLTQFGPTGGSPYAHLASLIWIKDGGLASRILSEQEKSGVVRRASQISVLDYSLAPRLSHATAEAKKALGI
jgi:hypothetical protein